MTNPDVKLERCWTRASVVALGTSHLGDRAVSPLSLSCQKQWHGKKKDGRVGLRRQKQSPPHTPNANGRWGMNWGTDAAWVIPCLWPKKERSSFA